MEEKTDGSASNPSSVSMNTMFTRRLFLGLIISATISTLFIVLPPSLEDKTFFSDLVAIISSGSAFALSMQVIYRQKFKTIFGKLYAAIGLGLGLWFTAEIIWAYYELIQSIEIPFPSIADAFWLAGYVPFAYFLFGILCKFAGPPRSQIVRTFLISSIGIAVLVNILISLYQSADLSGDDGWLLYLVSSAYPVSDMVLIVPAIAAFLSLRKGRLTFTPWAHFALATIIFIIGDTGFGYFAVLGGMDELMWLWNPFYNIGYLAIANSLFWHRHFYTTDEKKLLRAWQEKNR
jgi:branched-chain amino acid transport system substrate-binding protein